VRLESSIAIHRPPEVVWAFLGDLSNLPKWDRGVARAVPSPASEIEFHTETHANSPGNTRDRGKMSYRVSHVDSVAQRCTVDLTSAAGNARFFRRAQWIFHVTPTLSGSRVTCAVEFTLRPAYLFMAPVLYFKRNAIGYDLAQLKRAIESS
jgi:carbon monoxide dehydrogenase subunit G